MFKCLCFCLDKFSNALLPHPLSPLPLVTEFESLVQNSALDARCTSTDSSVKTKRSTHHFPVLVRNVLNQLMCWCQGQGGQPTLERRHLSPSDESVKWECWGFWAGCAVNITVHKRHLFVLPAFAITLTISLKTDVLSALVFTRSSLLPGQRNFVEYSLVSCFLSCSVPDPSTASSAPL